ncbi:reverse transcriptase domain-containing protein, partial [Tanacetum coccineum]
VVRYKEFEELIQPFKDPERVSQLDRKLLKTTVNDETNSTSVETGMPSIRRIDASQYADELKDTGGEKDLEAHYTNAKPLGKALPRKEKDLGSFTLPCFIKNMCFNKALADLGASVSVMPYSTYTTLGLGDLIPTKLIIELADRTVKRPKEIVENVLVGIDKFTFLLDFIILDIPEDFKTPLILGRPFLSTAHAIINVLIKSTELDLEARLMGNALRKNRSYDPKFEDYIELSDLNEPLELRHDQVIDLRPTTKEGEVIDTPINEIVKTRHDDNKITNGIKDYPSFSNLDRKIHVNNAYNLRFFCMIGYEHVDANFFPLLSINMMSKRFYNSIMKDTLEFKGKSVVGAFMNVPIFVGTFSVVRDFAVIEDMDHYRVDANFFPLLSINMMSKRFYNSIMKDTLEFKGKSVVGAFMNVPIFVGTFSVVTDFAVIEDMDHYRDEEMGDVIVGKVFCKEIRVKAK